MTDGLSLSEEDSVFRLNTKQIGFSVDYRSRRVQDSTRRFEPGPSGGAVLYSRFAAKVRHVLRNRARHGSDSSRPTQLGLPQREPQSDLRVQFAKGGVIQYSASSRRS